MTTAGTDQSIRLEYVAVTGPANSPKTKVGIVWEIENQGLNEAKIQHELEHIPHHHDNSVLPHWLLTALALTIERLCRLRYLHRGSHRRLSAIELCRLLRLTLARTPAFNSS